MLNRRQFLIGSIAASLSPLAQGCSPSTPWEKGAYRKRDHSAVAILEAKSYDIPLTDILLRGIKLFHLTLQGKRVLLKPNLVEHDPAGVINTHPAVIAAAVEAFRILGAREVLVADGPAHRRDNEDLLTTSGLYAILKDLRVPYVDLNTDDVRPVRLQSRFTGLSHLYLPETVLGADLLVSMAKLKTHHWAGVTLSLKNLFGIMPGAVYGWPKNLFHWAGIPESLLDINSTVPVPQFAIVDGIVGMEGNGPIHGEPKHCGVILFGEDPVAVDATGARLMKIDPLKINYLATAEQFLGNTTLERILQIGEGLDRFQRDFRVIHSFQYLKALSG